MDVALVVSTASGVAAVLSTVAAGVALKYAAGQLRVARQIREDAAQPYVYAEVGVSVTSSQLLVLSVRNTGQTAAKNVHVRAEPPLQNFDREVATEWKLSVLAPGAHLERAIDSGANFYARKGRPSRVTVHVSAEGPFGALRESYEVDLDELEKKLAAATPIERIANGADALLTELKRR